MKNNNCRFNFQLFFAAVLILSITTSANAAAIAYRFDYSGHVMTVGGTVLDGSLLPFTAGDAVSGSFTFDPSGGTQLIDPQAISAQFQDSITAFSFGSFNAIGTQAAHSSFLLDSSLGQVSAYKQVGTGSIYDNFSFMLLAGSGNSPFADVLFDLTQIKLGDYPMRSEFVLERVDISSNPLRFTEVRAKIDSITVSAAVVPVPAAVWLFGSGMLGLFGVLRRRPSSIPQATCRF